MRAKQNISLLFVGVSLLIAVQNVNAQDPHFSQFYAAQLYLNPAFAGSATGSRIMANYRHQWAGIPGAFVTYAFSLDHNFSRLNSGLGLYFQQDKAGSGGLRTTITGLQYAYHVKLSRKVSARFGADLSFRIRDIDFNNLIFNDQLSKAGIASTTTETPTSEASTFFDYGSGIIVFSEKYWVGVALHHLTQPNQALLGGTETILPLKYSVHGGMRIAVKDRYGKKSEKYVAPAFNYKGQHHFDQLDVGVSYYSNPVTFGIWYRGIPGLKALRPGLGNNDALIGLIGYRVDDLSIGYSYDLTISKLAVITSLGAHEISLVYEFNNKNQSQKKGKGKPVIIPCAKF
ncbi:MAG: type IX secretion system membrane protein PorP/SprF [Flavobacteriales bacterium]|nr:type IX secretion system membrane protein PorP/SprF [Flavobacteriales bacterium]